MCFTFLLAFGKHTSPIVLGSTLYTVHCTGYSVRRTVYSVHSIVYVVQCTVYAVHLAIYTPQSVSYKDVCRMSYVVHTNTYAHEFQRAHTHTYILTHVHTQTRKLAHTYVQCTMYVQVCTLYTGTYTRTMYVVNQIYLNYAVFLIASCTRLVRITIMSSPRTLYVVRRTLYTEHRMWQPVHCTVYSIHYTVHIYRRVVYVCYYTSRQIFGRLYI